MVRFDLPWDLVEEILSRVPATYLQRRLRFTCKRWNALFKDPEFIKKHLDKAEKPCLVLMLSSFRVYSLSVNISSVHNNIDVELRRNLNESEQVEITNLFHCNGLLLCSTNEEKTKLVVVNPCTGQTRWIKPRSAYDMFDKYALGYENNNGSSYGSYKILRFPGHTTDGNHLEIFELKSNSWRVLANIPPKVKLCILFGRGGVSLKGNTYWLSCFVSGIDILSFDFATEKFRSLCLPFLFTLPMIDSNTLALSVVREEQLSVLHLNRGARQMEIWMSTKIDTENFSWSKSFLFDLRSHLDLFLLREVSFFIDEEKKVIMYCGKSEDFTKNMIYIVRKHGCRKFDYSKNQLKICPWFLFSYVPNLVSL